MDPDRYERITRLFLKACELEPDERVRFLDEACGDDAELRAEVESLLAHDRSGGGTSPTETHERWALSDPPGAPPDRIGPYRVVRELGHGGMGVVYLAEQEEPIRRRVALKLIRAELHTEGVIARFESERQALALMSHSNVAKVFDAGATEQGRPYFVMEYVDGVPITDYCDSHRLSTTDRLALFGQVCEGVQHAHQKGVVHRDLKPSNVLVTVEEGKPVPKIIDFGLAKATEQRLTERSFFTQMGMLVGTPEYMSPEQADLDTEDIDTRTDVYSLGVLLYELLIGARPFEMTDLRQAALGEILRRIREDEPSKPSTRLQSIGDASRESAQRRHSDPISLARELRGDLDWITMRALEKDRARRYGSPMEFAADIGRYLAHEPVLASPPSAAYRARKFARRHRFGVAATAASVVVLIGFAATMAVQARRIASERDRAESVVEFQSGMLSEMDTEGIGARLMADLKRRVGEASRGRGLSEAEAQAVVRAFDDAMRGVNATDAALRLVDEEILARAVGTLEEKFAEQPLIEARLRGTIGATYAILGLYAAAEPEVQRALETRKRVLGDDHRDTLRSMYILAILFHGQGRYDKAEPLFRKTLLTQERVLGDDHQDTLQSMHWLARVYHDQSRFDEAEPLYLKTLEIQKRVLGDDHRDTLISIGNLAALYSGQGRYDEAEPLFLNQIEARKRVHGDDHPDTLAAIHSLGVLYEAQGRYDEAEPLQLEALDARKRVLGDDHLDTLWSVNNLAVLYWYQGRYDEAEPLLFQTFEARKRVLGDDHPATLTSMGNVAAVYSARGRYDEAEALHLETLEVRKRVLGDDHRSTLSSMQGLALLYHRQGRYDEAEALYLETLEARKRVLGDDHPGTLSLMDQLGGLYTRIGRLDEAEPLLQQALEQRRHVLARDHADFGYSYYNLGCLAAVRGQRETALDFLRKALEQGWSERDILDDPSLESLRGDPEFEVILMEVKKKIGEH